METNCFQLCKLLHFYNPGKIGAECFKVDSKSLFFQYHGKRFYYLINSMLLKKCQDENVIKIYDKYNAVISMKKKRKFVVFIFIGAIMRNCTLCLH